MKKILFFVLISVIGFSQNHIIHSNANSITILPTSIQSSRNPTVTTSNLSLGNTALSITASANEYNVAVGNSALSSAYDAIQNVALGYEAGAVHVFSDRNVSVGYRAMKGVGPSSSSGNNNDDNVAIGSESMLNINYSNYRNIGIGTSALRSIGSFQSDNIAIGHSAGYSVGGGSNIYFGQASGYSNTGFGNTFLGNFSGYHNQGSNNIFIGYAAGNLEVSSNKLYIENSNGSSPLIGGDFQANKVGINRSMSDLASRTESFQVSGDAYISGNLTVNSTTYTSDFRYKKNISPLQNPLESIQQITARRYDFDTEKFPEMPNNQQIGLIAQEVEKVYPELVKTDSNGYKSVDYARLSPILLEAIKVLSNRLEAVEKLLQK